ncbi:hypothetical protein DN069_02360 [Streptacidiphilus pinicola]|uniref:Uncharacterized protein n=1 Tax=Streptacidiphilus pinicola TaxID=2219663 RepID=A0A2X0JI56_9ACTN|nr:hypothetical protein [Streptacidiphilus pinicola]RAG87378.1 hypothetical protein DN069_02360 [Streptacidiphilus pinicola]
MADSLVEVAEDDEEESEQESEREPRTEGVIPGAGAIRKQLVFFLGLVPLAVAAMRVYLMGQGDGATMLTLVQTLDVRAVLVGTFAKPIGVLGTTASLYVFCRAYWPRMRRRSDPSRRRDTRWAGSRLGVLLLVLLASVGCLYPEEVLDWGNPSPWPVDVARAFAWVLAGQAVCWLGYELLQRVADRFRSARPRSPRRLLHVAADRAAAFCDAILRFYASSRPEVYLLVPAIVLVFWVYLVTNDRMWLPAQVVELNSAPACMTQAPGTPGACTGSARYPVKRLADGHVAVTGYILDRDLREETILMDGGGLLTVDRHAVAELIPCQDEPDFDPRSDAPLLALLSGFHPTQQDPPCAAIAAAKG